MHTAALTSQQQMHLRPKDAIAFEVLLERVGHIVKEEHILNIFKKFKPADLHSAHMRTVAAAKVNATVYT
jgi:hypothetical protein